MVLVGHLSDSKTHASGGLVSKIESRTKKLLSRRTWQHPKPQPDPYLAARRTGDAGRSSLLEKRNDKGVGAHPPKRPPGPSVPGAGGGSGRSTCPGGPGRTAAAVHRTTGSVAHCEGRIFCGFSSGSRCSVNSPHLKKYKWAKYQYICDASPSPRGCHFFLEPPSPAAREEGSSIRRPKKATSWEKAVS